ncbi:MAG: hypothetical protein WC331_10530 [Candidatus Omnitrophota bacterium]|jgi:hypothetical protein
MFRSVLVLLFFANLCANAFAAVGCSLNDPDRDVKRLFPESTGYRTTFVTIKEAGGEALERDIEERLGDKFDTVYESPDVPYAYYTVLKGKDVIGRIHGVNQKGQYGGLQLILATDPAGRIVGFYYQKISSPESAVFRNKAFTDLFKGLSLEDFSAYDVKEGAANEGRVSKIQDPSKNSGEDFRATLRGIKKNLILLDVFLHAPESGLGKEGGK